MPRQARKKSKTGIYHIMIRGINRQTVSKDDELLELIDEKYSVEKGCFHLLERQEINKILKDLKAIRHLVRVTGVSKYIVEKA